MTSAFLDSLLGEAAPQTAVPARANARAAALRDGMPSARDEAWKYTSLRALEQRRFVAGDTAAATRAIDAQVFALPEIAGTRLVFVNGVFRADLSAVESMLGLLLGTQTAIADDLLRNEALAPDMPDTARNTVFERVNRALAMQGPQLRVEAGVHVAEPVHLVFIGAAAAADIAWQIRAAISIGAGASLRIIEQHVAAHEHAHLGNVVATYTLEADARLDLVQIQAASRAAVLIRRDNFVLRRGAALRLHTIDVGAQLMRHDVGVHLAEPDARFVSRGVFALGGRQHADTHLVVEHDACDTGSDIAWRGVADQRAQGVFHGAIRVAAGADGAEAQLETKNLLLSPHAEIDCQPVLEIYADEVKAAHGATVGQLDENALFYLRSRGIPFDDARRILVGAFSRAMLSDIQPGAVRDAIDALLFSRVAAEEAAP